MTVPSANLQKRLKEFDFKGLFTQELMWNHFQTRDLEVKVDGSTYTLTPLAQRGMAVYECMPPTRYYLVAERDDEPYYIGKTGKPLFKRLSTHALKPNARRFNFWNYFSAFAITDPERRNEVEAILISAMPAAANSARPKIDRMKLDRSCCQTTEYCPSHDVDWQRRQ